MKQIPFMLKPASQDYLWGGSRLNDDFNLGLPVSPLAEAWMCSTHPDGVSFLSSGELLSDVLQLHPEWLGSHPLTITDGNPALPILIKLIDAKSDLSVQVHPDDEYAREYEGQWGKTEMWYVLGAKKESELIYGFNQDVAADQVRDAVGNGIGAGCLVAEIQQSSNLTYRLYDYNRTDKWGQKRELHLEKALDVAKLTSSATPRQPLRVLKYKSGYASELLTRCRYFQVERMLLNTENRKLADFQTEKNSFHALLCVDGCGVLYGDDVMLTFFKGDCIFVPAESIPLKLHGKAQILNVSC